MTFSPEQIYLVLDFESYSEADLKRTGSFEYSLHPSTEILCAAWRLGTRETLRTAKTELYAPQKPGGDGWGFNRLVNLLKNPKIIVIAHNAIFETVIIRNVIGRRIANQSLANFPSSRMLCTAALASALALPRKLEGAAKVLRLPVQKDMEGNRLGLKWAKPRKPSKHNPATRHSSPEEYERVCAYCVTDVDVEVELFLRCPPLTPTERQIWELDQEINLRGFEVDRPLVDTILKMIAEETKALHAETKAVTGGEVQSVTKLAQVFAYLEKSGAYLPNLQKKTIEDALADCLVTGSAKRLLEIRQSVSKTSTKKYDAFEKRSRHDGRLRDILVYHGASTGRWNGAGIQPVNFPKGTLTDPYQACEILREGDLEAVRQLYGNPMEVFSSCLRGMIVAPEGKVLDVGDFNAIELRVLFWVAKHEQGLKALANGDDLYKELATIIYKVKLKAVDDKQRFVAKQAILGSGFGLGWKMFQAYCKQMGQEISDHLARAAIFAYRAKHKLVVTLWSNIEQAAIAAVLKPGTKYTINRTTWWVKGRFLWCKLPSGRRLAYCDPAVEYDTTPWGAKRPVLYYWGVDPKTRQWTRQRNWGGGLVENCCGKGTLVLTSWGWVAIEKVKPSDRVFDGTDWVTHDGVIYQGEKETGSWCGVRLTSNHLIRAGNSWKKATDLDENTSSASLALGRNSVPWWLRNRVSGRILAPYANAVAEQKSALKRVVSDGMRAVAVNAGTKQPVLRGQKTTVTVKLSRVPKPSCFGYTGTAGLLAAATTQAVLHIKTMAHVAYASLSLGRQTVKNFLNTQKRCPAGMTYPWIWTESTTTGVISPGICAWSLAQLTAVTGEIRLWWSSKVARITFMTFGRNSVLNGKAVTALNGIWTKGEPGSKLWKPTGKAESVFDLVNCGPRHQFVVLTDFGPAIVHNCVQAIARDLMAAAMLRIDQTAHWLTVLCVHDELVSEREDCRYFEPGGEQRSFKELMEELPDWAEGLPVKVAAWSGKRYKK